MVIWLQVLVVSLGKSVPLWNIWSPQMDTGLEAIVICGVEICHADNGAPCADRLFKGVNSGTDPNLGWHLLLCLVLTHWIWPMSTSTKSWPMRLFYMVGLCVGLGVFKNIKSLVYIPSPFAEKIKFRWHTSSPSWTSKCQNLFPGLKIFMKNTVKILRKNFQKIKYISGE